MGMCASTSIICSCSGDDEEGPNPEAGYVDLGLPSGTLWATCNVGASKPEESGYFFAWGETAPKDEYEFGNYKYGIYTDDWKFTKYCTESEYGFDGVTDNITELLPEDDAATVNWGSKWQTPSMAQLLELCSSYYTTTTPTTQNGVNGLLIKSKKNDKSIFLPAASERLANTQNYAASKVGSYWSRSLRTGDSTGAKLLHISSEGYQSYQSVYGSSVVYYGESSDRRWYGMSIRPVRVLAQ